MKADKEILYNVIGYIICDLFLFWYLSQVHNPV